MYSKYKDTLITLGTTIINLKIGIIIIILALLVLIIILGLKVKGEIEATRSWKYSLEEFHKIHYKMN